MHHIPYIKKKVRGNLFSSRIFVRLTVAIDNMNGIKKSKMKHTEKKKEYCAPVLRIQMHEWNEERSQ